MIKVVIYEDHHTIYACEISGHANSGPYGYDLVCAGVSAVTFGTANALMEICEMDLIIHQKDQGGYLYIELPPEHRACMDAQLILRAMIISLQTIERDYNQFITIMRE